MKNFLFLLLFLLLIISNNFAHTGKPKYHVIIDTDGATDDFRAISLLLAENDVRILAITGSRGSISAQNSAQKSFELLCNYYNEGISVGVGKEIEFNLPAWADYCTNFVWADSQKKQIFEKSTDLLNRITKNYNDKITLIALGSLNTYAEWFKSNPEVIKKIDKIIWYGERILDSSFNYQVDKKSYDYINKTAIPIIVVSNDRKDLIYNLNFLHIISESLSPYAKHIVEETQKADLKAHGSYFTLWDDLIPLYLAAPMLFKTETVKNYTFACVDKTIPVEIIAKTFLSMLDASFEANNRVFISFPTDSILYKQNVAEILDSTILKFGFIEWKAVVMTNEIHGHTGIYSIIGAKMGIRAMEYFNVGVNNMIVVTFAGHQPPLSCFNDGVQISTGATIGQGLISISDTIINNPTAIFEFNNQKVKLNLKPEITDEIEKEVASAVKLYGNSPQYWLTIEDLAIKYWAELDRHKIFDIQIIK